MKPTDHPSPLTAKPHPEPTISQQDVKRDAVAHGDRIDARDATPAEVDAAERRRLAEHYPLSADAEALAARDRVRGAVVVTDDAARYAIIHQVDGRTSAIARELQGDAAVLDQLAAQLRLDARDQHVVTTAQATTIDVVVARTRSLAEQLLALCASRDMPLPQIPTLPAPAHVPPPRA